MNLKINLLALFALAACGGGYNPDRAALERLDQKISQTRFEILGSPQSLNYDAVENHVLGSGDLRMAPDLGESESAHSFVFEFALTHVNSELIFVSHADAKLQNGVELRFRRTDAAPIPRGESGDRRGEADREGRVEGRAASRIGAASAAMREPVPRGRP